MVLPGYATYSRRLSSVREQEDSARCLYGMIPIKLNDLRYSKFHPDRYSRLIHICRRCARNLSEFVKSTAHHKESIGIYGRCHSFLNLILLNC